MCGNCNPQYDVKQLLKKLQTKDIPIVYSFSDDEEYDVFMLINGCSVSCVQIPDIDVPKIEISGFSVNNQLVSEKELVDYIIQLLKNYKKNKKV